MTNHTADLATVLRTGLRSYVERCGMPVSHVQRVLADIILGGHFDFRQARALQNPPAWC
jgi:hypothetical protein